MERECCAHAGQHAPYEHGREGEYSRGKTKGGREGKSGGKDESGRDERLTC